jgi:hypothetical protein
MVLEMIRQGRLVLVIWGQESQNYSSEVIRLKSTKIWWYSWWPGGRLDRLPGGRSRTVFSQAKAKGNYQAWVHLDQMDLVTVRQEAGQCLVAQDTEMRVGKQLKAAKGTNKKRQSDGLKSENTYSF